MTLGDIIKEYRTNHNLSMDAFSDKSGISKAYISLLEKNKHPKSGKTIAPSIQCIKQAADGMGMDFNVLFSMIDGDVIVSEQKTDDITLTPKDERDITKDLQKMMSDIRNNTDGPLYYKGQEIDEASLILLENALEHAMRETKKINKQRFGRRKDPK